MMVKQLYGYPIWRNQIGGKMIKNIISQITLNDIYQIFFILCAFVFLGTKLKKQIHRLLGWFKWKNENFFVKRINKKYRNKKIKYINTSKK